MKILVGLGNIGSKYQNTYHNLGFMALDVLAKILSVKIKKSECDALTGQGSYLGKEFVLAKPSTFMNLSGQAVEKLLKKYKADCTDLIVVYDDVDINKGEVRVRAKGSAGTHNGMRHIIETIGSQDFCRIRIGAGRPPEGMDLAAYVLSDISYSERDAFNKAIEKAAEEAIKLI